VGAALTVAFACRGAAPSKPVAPVRKDAREQGAEPVPNLEPSALGTLAPEATEPVWRGAVGGDPMDLERLAVRQGAQGLLEWVREGGTMGRTALAALPYADDAEGALEVLCDWSERAHGDARRALLAAVHAIVTRPEPHGERLDAPGRERCRRALTRLNSDHGLDPGLRDLAQGARLALGADGKTKAP
jgi:hypothetical protein